MSNPWVWERDAVLASSVRWSLLERQKQPREKLSCFYGSWTFQAKTKGIFTAGMKWKLKCLCVCVCISDRQHIIKHMEKHSLQFLKRSNVIRPGFTAL